MRLVQAILVSVLLLYVSPSIAVPYNPATEIKKGVHKGFDITRQVTDFTPTIDDIASAGKDLVMGTPFQVILEGLNHFCSLALATDGDLERTSEVIPELDDVRIKFLDMKYNRSFNVESVAEMLQLETFNKDNPTVIVTTGWLSMRGNETSQSADMLLRAYQCRGNYNFIVRQTSSSLSPSTISRQLKKLLVPVIRLWGVHRHHLHLVSTKHGDTGRIPRRIPSGTGQAH